MESSGRYDPPGELFVGRAQVDAETDALGRAKGLVEAIENAYNDARDKNSDGRHFEVVQIVVSGDNPISEYTVAMRKVG